MPFLGVNVFTSCQSVNNYLITFNSQGGSFVQPQMIESGGVISIPDEPTKPSCNFGGWYDNPKCEGRTFDFGTKITKNITLYAKWDLVQNTISFSGEHISNQPIKFSKDCFDPIYVEVTTDEGYDPSSYISVSIEYANVWYIGKRLLKICPKTNNSFTIGLSTKIATYPITTNGQHLQFFNDSLLQTPLSEIEAKYNKNLVFYMVPETYQNSESYICPSSLNIFVGSRSFPLLKDTDYVIEDAIETERPALIKKVTIFGNKIVGDVTIGGEAMKKSYYKVEFISSYGIKTPNPELLFFLNQTDAAINFDFAPGYSIFSEENIYVKFNDEDGWLSPLDDKFKQYATFNLDDKNIKIKPSVISDDTNVVEIVCRTKDYPLLETLQWSEINNISLSGMSKYVFYLGEEKSLRLLNPETGSFQKVLHTVRIVDFNHDCQNLSEPESVVGMTFEFIEPISDDHGAIIPVPWYLNDSYDYTKSYLHHFLADTETSKDVPDVLYKYLPTDFYNVVKQVEKNYTPAEWKGKDRRWVRYLSSYKTKFFAPARVEIAEKSDSSEWYHNDYSREEGSIYQFFSGIKPFDEIWQRTTTSGLDVGALSTRSTAINTTAAWDKAWTINPDGEMTLLNPISLLYRSITPFFCI